LLTRFKSAGIPVKGGESDLHDSSHYEEPKPHTIDTAA